MAAETIREFLVSLGFKTDEAALKKFTLGINGATKAVFGLAAAIEGTAVLVAAGIAKFAANLEQLYFASLRTGSSALNLKALDRAAQNFGASAGEAVSAVEALALKLRENPIGITGFIEGLGVHMKDAKGNARDLVDVLIDLGKVWRNTPIQLAEQQAGLLGISDHMLLALQNGSLAESVSRIRKEFSYVDWGKVTHDAHEFENELRDLQTVLEAVGASVLDSLQKKLGFSLKDINAWIEKHHDEIAQWLIDAGVAIGHAATAIVTAIDKISTAYIAVLGHAKAFGDWIANNMPRTADVIGEAVNEIGHWFGLIDEEDYQRGKDYYDQTYNGGRAKAQREAENNPGNLENRGQAGSTGGGRFASFRNPQEGLDALGKQLELYGSRGTNTVRGIISTYAPASDHNDTAGYIEQVRKALGVGADAPLNLNDPAVLDQLMTAMVKREGNSKGVTGEMIQQAALNATRSSRIGGIADTSFGQWLARMSSDVHSAAQATIDQQTTINVYGQTDPLGTGKAVAAQQKRVNAELVRNLSPAVK